MNKIVTFLSGKKTYIVATLIALANVAVQYNVVPLSAHKLEVINAVLAALGLGALRAAVTKGVDR